MKFYAFILSGLLLVVLVYFVWFDGASEYQPETFRADIETMVRNEQYRDAIRLLVQADIDVQLDHDEEGYLLIAEDLIYRPGVPDEFSFPEHGDWEIPGTSDAVINKAWQEAATSFARRYNEARWELDHPDSD